MVAGAGATAGPAGPAGALPGRSRTGCVVWSVRGATPGSARHRPADPEGDETTMVDTAEGQTAATAAGDRALAAELRDRYGFLRQVVAEMEARVPYAAALVSGADGVRLSLRDG